MRIIFISLIVLSSIFANSIEIEKSKVFEISELPNMFRSSFSLNTRDADQTNIENGFANAINITSNSNICKGGKYNIYPHHKKDQYIGYINFSCKFEDKRVYEKLLSKIKILDNMKLSQGQIEFINNKDIIEESKNKLESLALSFPSSYEKFLEDNMKGFKCKIKKISFNQTNSYVPFRAALSESTMSTKVTTPIEEAISYKLNVDYRFICSK